MATRWLPNFKNPCSFMGLLYLIRGRYTPHHTTPHHTTPHYTTLHHTTLPVTLSGAWRSLAKSNGSPAPCGARALQSHPLCSRTRPVLVLALKLALISCSHPHPHPHPHPHAARSGRSFSFATLPGSFIQDDNLRVSVASHTKPHQTVPHHTIPHHTTLTPTLSPSAELGAALRSRTGLLLLAAHKNITRTPTKKSQEFNSNTCVISTNCSTLNCSAL